MTPLNTSLSKMPEETKKKRERENANCTNQNRSNESIKYLLFAPKLHELKKKETKYCRMKFVFLIEQTNRKTIGIMLALD